MPTPPAPPTPGPIPFDPETANDLANIRDSSTPIEGFPVPVFRDGPGPDTSNWIQMSPEAFVDPEPRRPKPTAPAADITTSTSSEAPVVTRKCCGRG
jgi:hypothetical protein